MFSQVAFGGPRAGLNIEVAVLDARNQALSGVLVQLKAGHAMVAQSETDALGHVHFTDLKPGYYEIAAGKQGYVAVEKRDIDLGEEGSTAIELTLVPAVVRKDSIEVKTTFTPVEGGASTPALLQASEALELPGRPATVADALPFTS